MNLQQRLAAKRAALAPESMAATVARLSQGAAAVSWDAGYAVRYDGRRVLFSDHGVSPARCLSQKRNAAGRCVRAVFVYADGSRLSFAWSEESGARITARAAGSV